MTSVGLGVYGGVQGDGSGLLLLLQIWQDDKYCSQVFQEIGVSCGDKKGEGGGRTRKDRGHGLGTYLTFLPYRKRHSCLHLTARRAKHETIRVSCLQLLPPFQCIQCVLQHVERTVGGNRPEEPPVSSSLVQGEAAGSYQAVILRDDVRCTIGTFYHLIKK